LGDSNDLKSERIVEALRLYKELDGDLLVPIELITVGQSLGVVRLALRGFDVTNTLFGAIQGEHSYVLTNMGLCM
jgi:hypothetical protein